jgi:leader peptidase (prepilin peptidase)/N-methyltransferase
LALLIYFCLVVVIDIEHRLIMHPISLVGAGLGLITGVYLHGLWLSLIGGAAGFAGMMLLYIFGLFFLRLMAFLRRTGVGVDEAVGFGDVTLSGVLGLMLGWPGITAGLILAILLGGLVSFLYLAGMLVARRYQAFSAIPYGPFLIAGAVILIFFRGAFLAAAM